jgi:hypothetical protein
MKSGMLPADIETGSNELTFELGASRGPGRYKVCYCHDYGDCDSPDEYFQTAGELVVVGIDADEDKVCYLEMECKVVLPGSQLNSGDALVVVDGDGDCREITRTYGGADGSFDGLSSVNFGTTSGVMSVFLATRADRYEVTFNLGRPLRVGRFRLCYCSAVEHTFCDAITKELTTNGRTETINLFDDYAGSLSVRGVNRKVNAWCMQGTDCEFELESGAFGLTDAVMLVDVPAEEEDAFKCGQKEGEKFLPLRQTDERAAGLQAGTFEWQNSGIGSFKICYCADETGYDCEDGKWENFKQDAGWLNVEGVILEMSNPKVTVEGDVQELFPTTHTVSFSVEAKLSGGSLTCAVAAITQPVPPTQAAIEKCELTGCLGVGTRPATTVIGMNTVHVTFTNPMSALDSDGVQTWCTVGVSTLSSASRVHALCRTAGRGCSSRWSPRFRLTTI